MGFIFDPSLVLYLPLYKLGGASFQSKDAYGHLCTVTGALWRPDGRWFDGSDDEVSVTMVETIKTCEFWWKPAAQITKASAAQGIVTFATTNDINIYIGGSTGSLVDETMTIQQVAGGGPRTAIHDYTFEVQFYHIVWVWSVADDRYNPYVNAVAQTPISSSGDVDLITTEVFKVGTSGDTAFGNVTFGEVRLYSRSLTPQEIQRNYLATKWRYR